MISIFRLLSKNGKKLNARDFIDKSCFDTAGRTKGHETTRRYGGRRDEFVRMRFANRTVINESRRYAPPAATLACREWEELRVGRDGLTEGEAGRLHAAATRAARRLRVGTVFDRTHQGLKAGQVVGILAIPGRTVEILPKIDGEDGAVRKALIRMLAVAHDLRVADGELAALDTQRHDLLELLARLFADRLLAAVRRGLPRRYTPREDDLRMLRGRLDVTRQLTRLAVRPDRLACRFDELSEDTPLNRVLKAAVVRLARLVRSAANLRSLAELAARFEAVGDSLRPLREPVRLDRTNTAFHDLHTLARLFLADEWQSTTSGKASGFALLFPMNALFEKFVGRRLRHAAAPRRVHLQPADRCALRDEDGQPLFHLRPDAVVEAPTTIVDTKWKSLEPGKKDLGVAADDIYQMLAYARAYDAARVILLYPWRREMGASDGLFRRWPVSGSNGPLDIATLDVVRPVSPKSV